MTAAGTGEVGVPYARQEMRDGRIRSICPKCGDGFTKRGYGKHYVAAHAVSRLQARLEREIADAGFTEREAAWHAQDILDEFEEDQR